MRCRPARNVRRSASRALLLAAAAAACAGGPKPEGQFAPGRFRTVPDTTAEGKARQCAWTTREGVAVALLDVGARVTDSAQRTAEADYLARLTKAVDDFFMPDDTATTLRRAVVQTTLRSDGDSSPITVRVPSTQRAFDTSAVKALELALTVESGAPPPASLDGQTILVGVGQRPASDDTLLTRFHVCPPRPASGDVTPAFPEALLRARVSGTVLAQFVIDPTGRPDMRTFRSLDPPRRPPPHPLFVAAVRDALPRMRYVPGTRDGKPARHLVQQPFAFGFQ